jgi:hypothetical protein
MGREILPTFTGRAMLADDFEKNLPYLTYIQIINSTFAPNFLTPLV